MYTRPSSSVSSKTTTNNTINYNLPHINKKESPKKKYKIISSSKSKGKKVFNSLVFSKTNKINNNNNNKEEEIIKNKNSVLKIEKINIPKHINVYEDINENQNNISQYSQFLNYTKTKSFSLISTTKLKKPKDITPQICSVYHFDKSKNLYLFIPNSNFLQKNKDFDTIIKYPNDNINLRNSTENVYQNLSIHQIEKKYDNFSLIHNIIIPFNYKIRMLSFGNMPKCFTDTCERSNIKFKKKPLNSNIIWHLYSINNMQLLIKEIHQNQHYNHFPSTFALGRKDFMYKHYKNYHNLFKDDYNYVPETFILPEDANYFLEKYKNIISNLSSSKIKFIVKPVGSSRGRGIRILSDKSEFKHLCKVSQIKHGKNYLISKYISKPHLINNKKYDLRIYVLISSLCPLKIYMYKEGLVRFATEEYTKGDYDNVFVHLTNYSINKHNTLRYKMNMNNSNNINLNTTLNINNNNLYNNNNNENYQNYQNYSKWSLDEYKEYFDKNNQSECYNNIMNKVKDIIVKTIISSLDDISADILNGKKNSLFELYGFDILVDNKFNTWLMEVNVGPSMKCGSPLDKMIKTNLVSDIFNVIGIKFYDHHFKDNIYTLEKKDYNNNIKKINKINFGELKADIYNKFDKNNLLYKNFEYDNEYFINGTLRDFEEEKLRSSVTNFEIIFPIKENIQYYAKFFSTNSNNVDNIVTWQYILTH